MPVLWAGMSKAVEQSSACWSMDGNPAIPPPPPPHSCFVNTELLPIQACMVPSIGRFQSCRYFLMTCWPGELSWHLCFTRDRPSTWLNHASGFHLLQCASCSRFAVKRHGSSSPSAVFRTFPCLHNGPSAQHVWCSLGKVPGRIWSLITAQ